MQKADMKKIFEALAAVDTPTICNALEVAMGCRTTTGFTYGTPIAAPKALPPIVGFARTMRFSAANPSPLNAEEGKKNRLAYFRYVQAQDDEPVVLVMEDIDEQPGIGSNWGEVNTTIHRALGVQGVLTNGSVRDLDMLDPDFAVIAASVGPSHAHAHIVDFNVPVKVLGMAVNPGDIIHADRHGGVVIGQSFLQDLPRCIELVTKREQPLLQAARKPGFSVDDIAKALQEAQDIH